MKKRALTENKTQIVRIGGWRAREDATVRGHRVDTKNRWGKLKRGRVGVRRRALRACVACFVFSYRRDERRKRKTHSCAGAFRANFSGFFKLEPRLRSSTPNSGIFGFFSRIFHFFSVIFYTNTGKWDSEIVKAFDIFDMHLVTTCAHASCISSQGDVAAPDIFAWACHMTPWRQSYEARFCIFHQNRPRWAPPSKFAIVTRRRAKGEMRG